jgi:myosin-crossreactive antigen
LFSLLYGFSQPSSIYYYYRHYSFYYRADENSVKLPKIHLILCKVSSITKELKLGFNNNTLPKAEEIEKCWHFVYDIYAKHRHAFENPSNDKLDLYNNHILQSETYEDFMRQYVMHIENETNVVSRIAVKSHSPLLAFKHPHHSNEYQSTAQTFDKTLNDIVERI